MAPGKRGRPRKVGLGLESERSLYVECEDELIKEECDEDEIDVEEINIDGEEYYLTVENVVLDKRSHRIVGIYKNGKIEKMKNNWYNNKMKNNWYNNKENNIKKMKK